MLLMHTLQIKVVFTAMQFMCAVEMLHLMHVSALAGAGMSYRQILHVGLWLR